MGVWDDAMQVPCDQCQRPRGTAEAAPVAEGHGRPRKVSEKQFQADVVAFAKAHGWRLIYHTYDSRRSEHGFPDLVMIRGERIVVAELKVPPNTLTPAQALWLDAFRRAKVPAYCWTPADWPGIEEVLA